MKNYTFLGESTELLAPRLARHVISAHSCLFLKLFLLNVSCKQFRCGEEITVMLCLFLALIMGISNDLLWQADSESRVEQSSANHNINYKMGTRSAWRLECKRKYPPNRTSAWSKLTNSCISIKNTIAFDFFPN